MSMARSSMAQGSLRGASGGGSGGGGSFNPATLFAAGEGGLMFIPSPGSCWKDAAGTMPATPGDAVAAIDDSSGNGNRWLLSGAVLRADSAGVWYVEQDGSGTVHQTRDAVSLNDPHLSLWVGSASEDGAPYVLVDTFLGSAPVIGSAGIRSGFRLGTADATAATFDFRGSGGALQYISEPLNLTVAQCAALRADQSKTTTGEMYRGQYGVTPLLQANPGQVYAGSVWSAGIWGIGARNNASFRLKGAIYFVIARNAETDDETYNKVLVWGDDKMSGYVPAAVGFAPGTTVDVLLIGGQSNAVGQGSAAESPVPLFGTGAWWNGADYAVLKDPVAPSTKGSAWPSFVTAYSAATGRGVLVVNAARGSSGLLPGVGTSDWSPSGANRGLAIAPFNAAIAHVAADPDVTLGNVYFAWQQGEQDGSEYNGTTVTDALYQAAQEELFAYFFANVTGLDAILVSELGQRTTPDPNYVLIRDAQNAAVAATANVHLAFAGAKDFPAQGKMIDAVHYNQAGLNEMGAAMGAFAATLVTP